MLKSIIQDTLGIKHHRIDRMERKEGKIAVYLSSWKRHRLPCSHCGTHGRVRDRRRERSWRHVPIYGESVTIHYRPARIQCATCSKVRVVAIPWSQGKSPFTKTLSGMMSHWAKLLALSGG